MIPLVKDTFQGDGATREGLAGFVRTAKQLSMGEHCLMFEREFAAKIERQYAVCVSSGSAANLLLVQALMNLGRLRKGDQVVASAVTWPTSVMPLIQFGLEVDTVDVETETLNVSPGTLYKCWQCRTKALFLTHALGLCDDIYEIVDTCRAQGIILIEDACEALGSLATGNRPLGQFGLAATFSFYVGHQLSTIEGGMVVTDDYDLYNQLVIARSHGWDRNLDEPMRTALRRHGNSFYDSFTFHQNAFNCRPTEITGFLGREQLRHLDSAADKRDANFKRLSAATRENPDILPLSSGHMRRLSALAFPVVAKTEQAAKRFRQLAAAAGVETRPIIGGNIARQPFFERQAKIRWNHPGADAIHDRGLYFTCRPDLTDDELSSLCLMLEP